MNPPERYQLVDGTFSATDARQILLSLVKSKIDFHNLEKASTELRLGGDGAQSERRLVELRQLGESLRLLCEGAVESGERLRVNGWIEIERLPATPSET